MVALGIREELRYPDPDHHRTARFPGIIQPEFAILHHPANAEYPVAPHHSEKRRSLAEHGKIDAALLRCTPGLVPQIPGRRSGTVRRRQTGKKPDIQREIASFSFYRVG